MKLTSTLGAFGIFAISNYQESICPTGAKIGLRSGVSRNQGFEKSGVKL